MNAVVRVGMSNGAVSPPNSLAIFNAVCRGFYASPAPHSSSSKDRREPTFFRSPANQLFLGSPTPPFLMGRSELDSTGEAMEGWHWAGWRSLLLHRPREAQGDSGREGNSHSL